MNTRNEIKAILAREGVTMSALVRQLSERCGWSNSVSNLSTKLRRGSLRYSEAMQLADALGCDIVWQHRDTAGTRRT